MMYVNNMSTILSQLLIYFYIDEVINMRKMSYTLVVRTRKNCNVAWWSTSFCFSRKGDLAEKLIRKRLWDWLGAWLRVLIMSKCFLVHGKWDRQKVWWLLRCSNNNKDSISILKWNIIDNE